MYTTLATDIHNLSYMFKTSTTIATNIHNSTYRWPLLLLQTSITRATDVREIVFHLVKLFIKLTQLRNFLHHFLTHEERSVQGDVSFVIEHS